MNTFPQNSLFSVSSKSWPCLLLPVGCDISSIFKLSPSQKFNLLNYWGSGMAHIMWDSKRIYTSTAHIGLTLSVAVFILMAASWWSDNKTRGLWCSALKYVMWLLFKTWDKVNLTKGLNPIRMERDVLYLKTQSVPHSKRSPSRL
jgi:hypothetical protein